MTLVSTTTTSLKMPHSVSPQSSPASDDDILPDAPAVEETAQAGDAGEEVAPSQPRANDETKLEDMFDDDGDDDDEFASSMDVSKSSQPAMYVLHAHSSFNASHTQTAKYPHRQTTRTQKSCAPSTSVSSRLDISSNG